MLTRSGVGLENDPDPSGHGIPSTAPVPSSPNRLRPQHHSVPSSSTVAGPLAFGEVNLFGRVSGEQLGIRNGSAHVVSISRTGDGGEEDWLETIDARDPHAPSVLGRCKLPAGQATGDPGCTLSAYDSIPLGAGRLNNGGESTYGYARERGLGQGR
jgi:hypothetical protein